MLSQLTNMIGPFKFLKTLKILNRSRNSGTSTCPLEADAFLSGDLQDDEDSVNKLGLENAFISQSQFQEILEEKPDSVLLVDCRSQEAFHRKRVRHYNNCINVPVAELEFEVSAEAIQERLVDFNLQSLIHWGRRDHFEYIVVYDNWTSVWEECLAGLTLIYDALTKFDDKCKSTKILLLQGGIQGVEEENPELIIENLLYIGSDSPLFTSTSQVLPVSHNNPAEETARNSGTKLRASHSRRYVAEDHPCLECPVCWTLPEGRMIFQCRNGHILCDQCLDKIEDERCPQCRVCMSEKKRIRSIAMENVIQNLVRLELR